MKNPYDDLPNASFWRMGVVQDSPFNLKNIYTKKWDISKNLNIGTGGSCFAQHISRNLKNNGFTVLDVEPPPPGLPKNLYGKFGFGMYSARYGNIYTVHQLLQLAKEAAEKFKPAEVAWEKEGRYFDAIRPAVEPEGLDSPKEVQVHRDYHLARVKEMFKKMDIFIFTLGLTEAWIHNDSQTVYPLAPGTIAGTFDESRYSFRNFRFSEIIEAFEEFEEILKSIRSDGSLPKFLLTVSPVPLTATASGKHVLRATTYSKSVLRCVAEELSNSRDYIDYFPSYEIITNPASRSIFYENNLRSVRVEGVETVMKIFFNEHNSGNVSYLGIKQARDDGQSLKPSSLTQDTDDDVQCEEALLEAFGK